MPVGHHFLKCPLGITLKCHPGITFDTGFKTYFKTGFDTGFDTGNTPGTGFNTGNTPEIPFYARWAFAGNMLLSSTQEVAWCVEPFKSGEGRRGAVGQRLLIYNTCVYKYIPYRRISNFKFFKEGKSFIQ